MRAYFGCLVTLLLYVLFSVGDPQYDADRNRILDIFHSPNVTRFTWERNMPELIAFYRRYPNAVNQTQAEKLQFEQFISEYNRGPTQLVDGVPAQGGALTTLIGVFTGKLGFQYISSLFNQTKDDEKKPTH